MPSNTEATEFGLQVFLDTLARALAAQAALFHAPKRRRGAGGVNVVDADNAELQLFEGP